MGHAIDNFSFITVLAEKRTKIGNDSVLNCKG